RLCRRSARRNSVEAGSRVRASEDSSRRSETMTNDRRLAVYMYFVNRDAMREGTKILNGLGYRYVEHPEVIDAGDADTTFIEAWKPAPAGIPDEDEDNGEGIAAIHEINEAIGMLGDAVDAGIFGPNESAGWWETLM